MSLLMLVFSVSPILAPLAGSLVIAAAGWRGVFWAVTIAALIALGLFATLLKETRPAEARASSTWSGALAGYKRLLSDPSYLGLVFVGSFGISAFFIYLSNSPFVLIDHYGLSPTAYSLFFSLNAVAFFGAAQFNGYLARRFGLTAIVRVAVTGFAGVLVLLSALAALGLVNLTVIAALLFVGYGCLGLVLPTTSVLAMEAHGAIAGTASALMGAIQMVLGAGLMAISGVFADGGPAPMVYGITACAVCSFLVAQFALRPSRTAAQAIAE